MRRHTIDVFVAQADVDDAPAFSATRVSQYIFGSRQGAKLIEQLQVNPPNLPLFEQGTAAYLGENLDVAASPSFLPGDTAGAWKFNTEASTSTAFHAAWTDNRDVRPPANHNWAEVYIDRKTASNIPTNHAMEVRSSCSRETGTDPLAQSCTRLGSVRERRKLEIRRPRIT